MSTRWGQAGGSAHIPPGAPVCVGRWALGELEVRSCYVQGDLQVGTWRRSPHWGKRMPGVSQWMSPPVGSTIPAISKPMTWSPLHSHPEYCIISHSPPPHYLFNKSESEVQGFWVNQGPSFPNTILRDATLLAIPFFFKVEENLYLNGAQGRCICFGTDFLMFSAFSPRKGKHSPNLGILLRGPLLLRLSSARSSAYESACACSYFSACVFPVEHVRTTGLFSLCTVSASLKESKPASRVSATTLLLEAWSFQFILLGFMPLEKPPRKLFSDKLFTLGFLEML